MNEQPPSPLKPARAMTMNELLLEAFKAPAAAAAPPPVATTTSDDLVAKLLAAHNINNKNTTTITTPSAGGNNTALLDAAMKTNSQNLTHLSGLQPASAVPVSEADQLVAKWLARAAQQQQQQQQRSLAAAGGGVNEILLEALKGNNNNNNLHSFGAADPTTDTSLVNLAKLLQAAQVGPSTAPVVNNNTTMLLDAATVMATQQNLMQPISSETSLVAKLLAHQSSSNLNKVSEEDQAPAPGGKTHSLADIMSEAMPVMAHTMKNRHTQTNTTTTTTTGRSPLPAKKARRGPLSRSSAYRGVTFYRRTTRWEAHVWTNGKQQYLGGYKEEEAAARAYDKAVIKIRGKEGDTNFPSSEYVEEMKRLRADELTVGEFILTLREEAKRENKRRREMKERDDPYRETLRLKSCRKWLEKTFKATTASGVGIPTTISTTTGIKEEEPALVQLLQQQNTTAANLGVSSLIAALSNTPQHLFSQMLSQSAESFQLNNLLLLQALTQQQQQQQQQQNLLQASFQRTDSHSSSRSNSFNVNLNTLLSNKFL
jgi:hypothetical protein